MCNVFSHELRGSLCVMCLVKGVSVCNVFS